MGMPVMRVRAVWMGVHEACVCVSVRVCSLGGLGVRVGVLMVLVVDVPVRVDRGLVSVGVFVTLSHEEPRREEDERKRSVRRDGRPFAEDAQRDRGREERRGSEQRPRSGRAKLPQRTNEERNTRTVRDSAQCQRGESGTYRWEWSAERKRQEKRERPGAQALQNDDRLRIAQRDVAREVVVESPKDAGADNQERSRRETPGARRVDGQEDCADRHEPDCQPRNPPDGLAEENRGEPRRSRGLEREQERCRGRGSLGKPEEEAEGRCDSSNEDRGNERRDVATLEARFLSAATRTSEGSRQKPEAGTSSQVQEAGEDDRVYVSQEKLR